MKGFKFMSVIRGLIFLILGGVLLAIGIVPDYGKNGNEAPANIATGIAAIFGTIFLAIGIILVFYAILIFTGIARTKRGVNKGFIVIDIILNILILVGGSIAVIVKKDDFELKNIIIYIGIFAIVAIIGFIYDALGLKAQKEFFRNGGTVAKGSGAYTGFALMGSIVGILPEIAISFAGSVLSLELGSGNNDMLLYALLGAAVAQAIVMIMLSSRMRRGKGGLLSLLLIVLAIGAVVLSYLSFKETLWMVILAAVGEVFVLIAAICAISARNRIKREESRKAKQFQKNYVQRNTNYRY